MRETKEEGGEGCNRPLLFCMTAAPHLLVVVTMMKASSNSVGSRRKMKAGALGIGGIAMAEEAVAACDGGCRRERGGVIASGGV